jgi:hypothetical protein
MLPAPRRKPLGRKSIYKPEYCALVEQWGKEGKSQSQMCSLLNIGRATFHEWKGSNEEFGASVTRAMEHAQAWWEGKAQKSLGKKQFQAQLWRYSMMGRFKDDYAEQRSSGLEALPDFLAAITEVATGRKIDRAAAAKPIEVASSFEVVQDPEKREK